MPEYLPQVQLPQGLAEETARMMQQNAMIIPNALNQAGQNLIGGIQQGIQRRYQQKQDTLTPEQAKALGYTIPDTVIGPDGQVIKTSSLFENGRIHRDDLTTIAKLEEARQMKQAVIAGQFNQQHTVANDNLLKNYPGLQKMGYKSGDAIPNRFIQEQSKPSGSDNSLQVDKFVQSELDKSRRVIDPMVAAKGAPLGTAGLMKTRIATARETLRDPNMTPQGLAAVSTDLAGIVQMGTPHESGIKDQNYQTWWTRAYKLVGEIRNSPQSAGSTETVKKLTSILDGYDKVYNKVVNSSIDTDKASKTQMFKKYPGLKAGYEDMESKLREQYPSGPEIAPSGMSVDDHAAAIFGGKK